MTSSSRGSVPRNVETFLESIRTLANGMLSWTDDADFKFSNGTLDTDGINEMERMTPYSTLMLVKEMTNSLAKEVKAMTGTVESQFTQKPLSNVMKKTLMSYCQMLQRLVSQIKVCPDVPILMSATASENNVLLEVWIGPRPFQAEDPMSKLTVTLLIDEKPLIGPLNLSTIGSIAANGQQIVASFPITLSLLPKSMKISAQVLYEGDHIEGSPAQISSNNQDHQTSFAHVIAPNGNQWTPVGDESPPKSSNNYTNLDESDMKCLALNTSRFPFTVPREQVESDLNADDSGTRADLSTQLRNFRNFHQTLPTVPELSKDDSESNSTNKSDRELTGIKTTPTSHPPTTSTSAKQSATCAGDYIRHVGLDATRQETSFQNTTISEMSETWLPTEPNNAELFLNDQPENPHDKVTANPPATFVGTPKAVKELRPNPFVPEAIPLDQPSPLSARVIPAPRRSLDIDEHEETFNPSVSSTSSNLNDVLRKINNILVGGTPKETGDVAAPSMEVGPEPVLSSSYKDFHHSKTIPFADFLKQDEVVRSSPQDLAVDPILNRLYVIDTGLHKVFLFQDNEYVGGWAQTTQFRSPCNILVLSNTDTPHDILVLDKTALRLFDKDGNIKGTFFEGQATNLRALAFHQDSGRIVTLEFGKEDLKIVFFDYVKNEIVEKVPLMSKTSSKYKTQLCRFLDCSKDKVVVSDLGNDCLYMTDLVKQTTHTVNTKSQGAGHPSGIVLVDEKEVFVGVSGKVVCFSTNGKLVGSLDVTCASDRIGSLRYSGGKIFFTDYSKHAVHILAKSQ